MAQIIMMAIMMAIILLAVQQDLRVLLILVLLEVT
jgi:hypothetical protein